MKITKQRLKDIIKEELDAMRGSVRLGADIDELPEPPEEEPTRDRAFDSPEGRLVTLMNAREKLNQMTTDQLKDLSMSLDAPMFATLLHILGPMYAPMGGQYHDQGHEMELEEERGAYSSSRYAKRADGSEPGEQSANLKYRGGPEAAQSQKRIKNYRSGATGKRNQGRGGY